MRIVPNADGQCFVIMQDNHICSFVSVRPRRAEADAETPSRKRLSGHALIAWASLADSVQRLAGFRRAPLAMADKPA